MRMLMEQHLRWQVALAAVALYIAALVVAEPSFASLVPWTGLVILSYISPSTREAQRSTVIVSASLALLSAKIFADTAGMQISPQAFALMLAAIAISVTSLVCALFAVWFRQIPGRSLQWSLCLREILLPIGLAVGFFLELTGRRTIGIAALCIFVLFQHSLVNSW